MHQKTKQVSARGNLFLLYSVIVITLLSPLQVLLLQEPLLLELLQLLELQLS